MTPRQPRVQPPAFFEPAMKPFSPPGTAPRYATERPFRITDLELTFEPDLEARVLRGQARLSLQIRRDGVRRLSFDAVELDVESVRLGDEPVSFDVDDRQLHVFLPTAAPRGASFVVHVVYRCS